MQQTKQLAEPLTDMFGFPENLSFGHVHNMLCGQQAMTLLSFIHLGEADRPRDVTVPGSLPTTYLRVQKTSLRNGEVGHSRSRTVHAGGGSPAATAGPGARGWLSCAAPVLEFPEVSPPCLQDLAVSVPAA